MARQTQDVGSLHCPYVQCRKKFEKPIVLTDSTKIVRETYYACPHCFHRLDVIVDREKGSVVEIKMAGTYHQVEVAPAECKHYFGFLKNLSDDALIPDECAICSKIMQCFVRKPS